MGKTPLERIARVWLLLESADRTDILFVVVLLLVGHTLSGIIMSNKAWSRVILFVSVLAYALFFLAFADRFPQLVFIAGIFLGAILVAALFSSVFFRGKDGDNDKK
jgi:fucose permease